MFVRDEGVEKMNHVLSHPLAPLGIQAVVTLLLIAVAVVIVLLVRTQLAIWRTAQEIEPREDD